MTKKENQALHTIFTNLLKGSSYGTNEKNYFNYKLYIHPYKNYICYSNYGSSAIEISLNNLAWIIEKAFNMTPTQFIEKYELN